MINDEVLLKNGYKKFNDDLYNAQCLFQKAIRNEKGRIKYYIDIYKYDLPIFEKPSYEARLVTDKDNYSLNILFYCLNENVRLEELERDIYATWYGLDCKYYGRNE